MGADGARKRKIAVIAALAAAVLLLALLELLVGSSGMSVRQCVSALFGREKETPRAAEGAPGADSPARLLCWRSCCGGCPLP